MWSRRNRDMLLTVGLSRDPVTALWLQLPYGSIAVWLY